MRGILLLLLVARCLETIDACIWHMFVDLQFRLPVSMKLSSRIALLTCPINSHVTYQWGEVLHVDPFHSLVGLKNQLA